MKNGKRKIRDGDGVEVVAGCEIRFSFGLPPVGVLARVIERDGELFALTPDHNPKECKVRDLRRHVGDFWISKGAARMVGFGTVICDRCLGDGAVRTNDGGKLECVVCDGTGRMTERQREAAREFDRKEADYVENSGVRRGDLPGWRAKQAK
jgi:hypothetical protein